MVAVVGTDSPEEAQVAGATALNVVARAAAELGQVGGPAGLYCSGRCVGPAGPRPNVRSWRR